VGRPTACGREGAQCTQIARKREHNERAPMRERGSIARIPMCLSGCMLHRGRTKPGVQGRLVRSPFSSTLHACMHALHWEVLGRLGTDRLLHARPTVGAGPHDKIGSTGWWVRAAHACPRVREHGKQHLLQHTETR
jgi:hypothetical protein